jgi:hypothetical protein
LAFLEIEPQALHFLRKHYGTFIRFLYSLA